MIITNIDLARARRNDDLARLERPARPRSSRLRRVVGAGFLRIGMRLVPEHDLGRLRPTQPST